MVSTFVEHRVCFAADGNDEWSTEGLLVAILQREAKQAAKQAPDPAKQNIVWMQYWGDGKQIGDPALQRIVEQLPWFYVSREISN